MPQPTVVYVLHDVRYGFSSVTTDKDIAESWITYDPDFRFTELELDDFSVVNEAADSCEAYDDAQHLAAAIGNTKER